MAGLTAEEREKLRGVIARRVGPQSDAGRLTSAYLDAMEREAYTRTIEPGPVPTNLTAERSTILIEISRQLNRVIEDFEIQALFRVSAPQARAMRTTLLATYTDDTNSLTLEWSKVEARTGGRKRGAKVTGTVIIFAEEARRDAFVDYAKRTGHPVETVLGDETMPWRVIVGDSFDKTQLPPE